MTLISRELDYIVKSMKMLDLRSLNDHQKQTLLEFQNGIAAGETGEELESKEKKFRNMLSEVKFRSDNMRRQKLHQKP
jgi:hypothetical protein